MCAKVWVLTSSYNDYDQHGEYFEAVFAKKPDLKILAEFFKMKGGKSGDVMEAVAFLEHVRAGGGRRGTEHMWYGLDEVSTL